MIIISQDGKNLINFDNVKSINLNDTYSDKECNLIAHFTDGSSNVIAAYRGADKGHEIINFIADNYKGSATIKLGGIK